jgi:transposase
MTIYNSTKGIPLPEQLDDYVTENNPVRIVDAFVSEIDLGKLFETFLQSMPERRLD